MSTELEETGFAFCDTGSQMLKPLGGSSLLLKIKRSQYLWPSCVSDAEISSFSMHLLTASMQRGRDGGNSKPSQEQIDKSWYLWQHP